MKNYLVKVIHDVFVDDYDKGELNFVNCYETESQFECESWRDAVNNHLQNVLCFNLDTNNCEVFEDIKLETSCLVDGGNSQPSELEMVLWRKNEITLYSNQMQILVFEIKQVINFD